MNLQGSNHSSMRTSGVNLARIPRDMGRIQKTWLGCDEWAVGGVPLKPGEGSGG